MARSQEDATTILLGLKGCKVGEVVEDMERVVVKTAVKGKERKCPFCSSAKLYRHGMCKPRQRRYGSSRIETTSVAGSSLLVAMTW